jgi:hypothetical protein
MSSDITIEDYSDKAIAVFGDTKPIKDVLNSLKGKFNPSLRGNGDEKRTGWIFPKTKKNEVVKAIQDYKNNPESTPRSSGPGPHSVSNGNTTNSEISSKKTVKNNDEFNFTKEMYLALLTRIEKQETELLLCKKIIDKFTNNGNYNFAVDVKKPTNTILTTDVSKKENSSRPSEKQTINLKTNQKQVSKDLGSLTEDEDDVDDVSSSSDEEEDYVKPMKNLLKITKK